MKKLFVLLFSSIFVFSILFANGTTHAKDTKPPTTLTIYKVSNKTTAVGGKTEAKATVEVKLGSKLLGKATADSKGKYKVRIKAQKAGTKLTVIARDRANNAKTVKVTIADKIAPKTLTVSKVTNKTTYVTGKTEAKTTVEVKLGSELLGKATADSKGNYKVKIKAQKKGTKLTVVAIDKAGNAKKVTVAVLVGGNNEMGDKQLVTEEVEASNFILKVSAPTVIENGQILKVKGTLKYVGDEMIKLFHGGPIIRFSFTGSNENRSYKDMGYTTQLETGQIIEVEDEFKVSEVGKHSLIARTTILEVDGELIVGIGNEEYIKSDMSERIIELEKSKITLKPIMIEVREE